MVTINLDALNHITDYRDWGKIFRKVYKSLNSSGIFIFDVNSRNRLIRDWNYPEVIIKKDLTYVQCGLDYTIEPNFVRRKILMLIFEDVGTKVQKYSAIIEQISMYKNDIYKLLKSSGFKHVKEYYKPDANNLEHIFLKNRFFFYVQK